MEILNELKRDTLKNLLSQGKRADGRKQDEYRPFAVSKGVLQNAEGSALATIGNTKVLCGVKFDVATPFADRPKEGVLSTGAELVPLASHLFEPGPPSENAIELARVVDRGIRSSEAVDLESFFIEDGKVIAMYVDLYVLDHDGNLIDTAALAAMGALSCARVPRVENLKMVRNEFTGPLKLASHAVSCTFSKVDSHYLLDPALDEELGADTRLTISTTEDGRVCAGQKGGWGAFTKNEVMNMIDMSFERGKALRAAAIGE
jgi:exosome complex component RRP42